MSSSPGTEFVILARNLTRIYPLGDSSVIGINQLNLEVSTGELVVLKGNSGSGKSTLLSLLAGLDRPTSGDLFVAGRYLSNSSSVDLTRFRREVVGVVFQSFNLLPTLSVIENVCLPALLANKDREATRRKALEFLDWLGLKSRRNHHPDQETQSQDVSEWQSSEDRWISLAHHLRAFVATMVERVTHVALRAICAVIVHSSPRRVPRGATAKPVCPSNSARTVPDSVIW